MQRYVATLKFADKSTVKVTFKSRATKTSTVATHAREAAEREGYSDFTIERLVPILEV